MELVIEFETWTERREAIEAHANIEEWPHVRDHPMVRATDAKAFSSTVNGQLRVHFDSVAFPNKYDYVTLGHTGHDTHVVDAETTALKQLILTR